MARRGQLSVTLLTVVALAGVGWYMLHTSAGIFSRTARLSRRAVQRANSPAELSKRLRNNTSERSAELERSVREMTDRIRSVARDVAIPQEVERLLNELDAATKQLDLKSLAGLKQRTTELLSQLNEAYEVHIVSGADTTSGIERDVPESSGTGLTGYYVIVEARDSSGRALTRSIRNADMNRLEQVTRWAERVPKEVYERIQADLKIDGLLDETLFAVKRRGNRQEEIKLIGSDNQPLSQLGQITKW